MSVYRRPILSLSQGIKSRPAAEKTEPTTMQASAAVCESPRSCASSTMMGLNSSTAGVASPTTANISQYWFVLSISFTL